MRIPTRTLLRGLAPSNPAASRRERTRRAIAAVAASIASGARPAPDVRERGSDVPRPSGG